MRANESSSTLEQAPSEEKPIKDQIYGFDVMKFKYNNFAK